MSWVEGRYPDKQFVDVNDELEKTLKGDLSESVARRTLGRFLMYNVGFLVKLLTGFKLDPDQRILIKGWLNKNFSITIAGRGYSKSWLFSHFCYLYCIFNPGKTIVMIAPTFRSSRRIIQAIEKWARKRDKKYEDKGFLLRQCIRATKQGELVSKQSDLWEMTFKNGSKIISLPLGDGERLRGYRCSVLGIDEGLSVPQQIIDTVLKPFLVATPEDEILRRQTIREREERLIKKGLMKPEERTKFSSDVKMIIISSASYSWEDLYKLYASYLKKIYAEDKRMVEKLEEKERAELVKDEEAKAEILDGDDIPSSYLVHQLSYRVADHWKRVESSIKQSFQDDSETNRLREYEAQFVQDSDGYFRAKVMEECTLKGVNDPTVEIVGDPKAQYIVAIDPNMAGSETNDHFAICVIKIIERKFHDDSIRKCGLVVHQYANAGAKPEDHIRYFLYILKNFNVVYVAVDSTQGGNMGFINFCNESMLFKSAKRNLQPIQFAEFGKENFDTLVADIQRGYNLTAGQIVQQQYFHSTFQLAANEHMQTCFNRRMLWFAAKALPNETAMATMREQHGAVTDILSTHPDFVGIKSNESKDGPSEVTVRGDIDDFIAQQDVLIDLVKKECALIEIKTSSLGNTSFDLPAHMKKQSKSKSRIRKDNYSALFLGNWALKLYLESQERPHEEYSDLYVGWALPRGR